MNQEPRPTPGLFPLNRFVDTSAEWQSVAAEMPYPELPPQPGDWRIGVFWLVLVVLATLGLLAPLL